MTKLYENTFRAVNIAFANEMAGREPRASGSTRSRSPRRRPPSRTASCRSIPVPASAGTASRATRTTCCAGLRELQADAPILERAMSGDRRAAARAWSQRAVELLERGACEPAGGSRAGRGRRLQAGRHGHARVAGGARSCDELADAGVEVAYHDPLVRSLELGDGLALLSVARPRAADFDLAIVVTLHEGYDYGWLRRFGTCSTAPTARRCGARRSLI